MMITIKVIAGECHLSHEYDRGIEIDSRHIKNIISAKMLWKTLTANIISQAVIGLR